MYTIHNSYLKTGTMYTIHNSYLKTGTTTEEQDV